jgi:hypothetical protein
MRRTSIWAAAGACLSPLFGVPVWLAFGPDLRFLPPAVAIIGAAAGVLVGRRWRPSTEEATAGFVIAYLLTGVMGTVAAGNLPVTLGFLLVVAAAVAASAGVGRQLGPRGRWELAKLAAGVAWVLTVVLLPVNLFGLVLMPLAVSLTIRARALESAEVPA